jgi:hypothetical protein
VRRLALDDIWSLACWRAQQLKGRVHPVEQSNTDEAEQQDGKGE